jgi:hypothetical protein
VAGHAAQAPVDGLALEAGTGRLDFGDDVTPCKLGCTRAPLQSVDGVEDGVSATRTGVGDLGLQWRDGDGRPVDGVVAVRIV